MKPQGDARSARSTAAVINGRVDQTLLRRDDAIPGVRTAHLHKLRALRAPDLRGDNALIERLGTYVRVTARDPTRVHTTPPRAGRRAR